MRPAIVALAVMLALLTVGEHAADAAMSRKACRSSCASAIASCVTVGGRQAKCRRQLVQRCRKQGPAACGGSETPGSTPWGYPNTTLYTPYGATDATVTVHTARTVFELGWYVAPAGAELVLVDVTIVNGSNYAFLPYGIQLQAGGLAFQQVYPVVIDQFRGCWGTVSILPGGSLSCTLPFEITEGAQTARLALGPEPVISDEFAIPVVVRPSATLDIIAAGAVEPSGYCGARPGFEVVQVTFAYASHDGASGLDLTPSQFVLQAAGAIYDPLYCGYSVADPCDGAIGVPVNGSASCTLMFQVPTSVSEAALLALTRYPASATFGLD
jgi:hypothetical protein